MRGRAHTAVGALVVAYVVALSPLAGTAVAENAEEAKVYLDKATTAFALSQFDVAAENFEQAFKRAPDPSLLYNAAQSYRLAGNKQRALERYQSYLRMYGNDKREEIEKHIEDLKKAIEHDKEVATSPPTGTDAPKGDINKAPPPKTETTGPVLVSRPENRQDERPLTSKPWFWGVVGGGAVAAVVVVLLLAAGGPDDPAPSIGRAGGP